MDLRLVVRTAGKLQGKSIPVNQSPFTIGRDPSCQLRPSSALISGRHCVLLAEEGTARVRDLGSTNGTFLNGQLVHGERELRHADVLRIGPLDLEVEMQAASSLDRQTPLPPAKESRQTPDEKAAILHSLEEKSSHLLHDPGIESDGVPAGQTMVDFRIRPVKPADSDEDEDEDEETHQSRGPVRRMFSAARKTFRRYFGGAGEG